MIPPERVVRGYDLARHVAKPLQHAVLVPLRVPGRCAPILSTAVCGQKIRCQRRPFDPEQTRTCFQCKTVVTDPLSEIVDELPSEGDTA